MIAILAATFRTVQASSLIARMKYVSVFYEGEHNDARTNVCIALTAAM